MKLLLVDSQSQTRDQLSHQLQSKCSNWAILTAASGDKALELLDANEVEILVSDMQLNGMEGSELLLKVADRFPKVRRIALASQWQEEIPTSVVSSIDRCLPDPLDIDELIRIIQETENKSDQLAPEEVLEAIGRRGCLPSIPDNLVRLNEVLDTPDSDFAEIAEIVSEDPSLSAKILQLANSAMYSLRYPVKDISRGVNVIGKSSVRAIAVTNAIFSIAQYDSILSPDKLFEHCFDVAEVVRQLTQIEEMEPLEKQTTVSGGLLHDVGKVVLVNAFPEQYETVLTRKVEEERNLWELESEEFGVSHQRVGQYLLDRWGIPTDITSLVGSHHDFEGCAIGTLGEKIVYASDWIANGAKRDVIDAQIKLVSEPTEEITNFEDQLLDWANAIANR